MDISLPPFLFYGLSPLPIPSNVKYLSRGGGGEANFQRERGGVGNGRLNGVSLLVILAYVVDE